MPSTTVDVPEHLGIPKTIKRSGMCQTLGGTQLDPELPTDEWKIIDQASAFAATVPGHRSL